MTELFFIVNTNHYFKGLIVGGGTFGGLIGGGIFGGLIGGGIFGGLIGGGTLGGVTGGLGGLFDNSIIN